MSDSGLTIAPRKGRFTRRRKVAVGLVLGVVGTVAAVAWAAIWQSIPFVGTVTGQPSPPTVKITSVTPVTFNGAFPGCSWSVEGGQLVLAASNVPTSGATDCYATVSALNTTDKQMVLQEFRAAVTGIDGATATGTVKSGDCGRTLQAAGTAGGLDKGTFEVRIRFSGLTLDSAGTLSGAIDWTIPSEYVSSVCRGH